MRADFESFRKSHSSQGERHQMPSPGEAQARSSKRRASHPEGEGDLMETESNSKALESMQQSITQIADTMTSILKRMSSLESTQAALATSRSSSKGPSRAQSPAGAVAQNPAREWLIRNSNHGGQH